MTPTLLIMVRRKLHFKVIQVCQHLDISRFTVKNYMTLYNVYLPFIGILLFSVKNWRTVKTETLQFYHLNYSSVKFMTNFISLTHLEILKPILHYLLLFKIFLIFQDTLPMMFHSGLAYKYNCCESVTTYYSTTKLHFKVIQVSEHLDTSRFTVKNFMMLYNVYLSLMGTRLSSVKNWRTVKTKNTLTNRRKPWQIWYTWLTQVCRY